MKDLKIRNIEPYFKTTGQCPYCKKIVDLEVSNANFNVFTDNCPSCKKEFVVNISEYEEGLIPRPEDRDDDARDYDHHLDYDDRDGRDDDY